MSTVEAMSSMRREARSHCSCQWVLMGSGATPRDGACERPPMRAVRSASARSAGITWASEPTSSTYRRRQDWQMAHPAVVGLPQFEHGVSVSLMTSFGSNGCSA